MSSMSRTHERGAESPAGNIFIEAFSARRFMRPARGDAGGRRGRVFHRFTHNVASAGQCFSRARRRHRRETRNAFTGLAFPGVFHRFTRCA